MRRLAALLAALLGACATPPQDRCFVQDEAMAREIAALVAGTSPDDGSLQIQDQGDHWRVGRYAETRMEGDMIVSEDRGFTFRMEKCTGAKSGYRSWP
ncbi:MAG: hypothetical protein ACREH4_08330 [Vitreimonas sp.]